MTQRTFIILLILLAMAVALSATSFPGSMIGFLVAIAGVFFVAVPGAAIGDALRQGGIPITGEQLPLGSGRRLRPAPPWRRRAGMAAAEAQ